MDKINLNDKTLLVTGAAGFIGSNLVKRLHRDVKGETIQLFNYGNCHRDFTYVDDIIEGIVRVMQGAPEHKKGEDGLPIPSYAIYNIGSG